MKKYTAPILMLLFLCLTLDKISAAQSAKTNGHWVSVWAAADYAPFKFLPTPPEPALADQTIRMVIKPSLGGQRLRIRLSNAFGSSAVTIGAAHIALTDQGSRILPETDRVLTFGGNTKISIPAGAPVISDPVDLSVKSLSEISISIYLPSSTPVSTWHTNAQHGSYLSGPGDLTGKPELTNSEVKPAWYFLSSVEMWEPAGATTTVALGDSITEGSNNLPLSYVDYPDQLAERLASEKGGQSIAIVNEGIGGNRILHDAAGISALARFDADVLSQPSVTNLIVFEGINDIGFPRAKIPAMKGLPPMQNPWAAEQVSAEEIINGLRQIIVRAHEHGIRVFGATMTPFEGSNAYDADGEAIRQAVNQWIRTANAFDGVFDFDAVVRDPEHPSRIRADYDTRDHIHPNAAGYKAMADSISLTALSGTQK